jgi:hypothetical protein
MDREEVGWQVLDWTDQTQDRDKWRTVLNAVINLGFRKMTECRNYVRNCQLYKKVSALWS